MRWILAILLVSCTPSAVDYVKSKNPECRVDVLERAGKQVKLLIRCPRENPRREVVIER